MAIDFAGHVQTDQDPNDPITAGADLVLIGDEDAFTKFQETYKNYS